MVISQEAMGLRYVLEGVQQDRLADAPQTLDEQALVGGPLP